MTLKEIKKHYRVRKMDGYYDLSTLEVDRESRSVHRYLCTIYKNNTQKFHLNGYKPVSKFDDLQKQIEGYLDSLEYNSEYYCPSYVKGTAQNWLLFDLLYDYGFRRNMYSDSFRYMVKSIYGHTITNMVISYDINVNKEEVSIVLNSGDYSWITVKSNFDLGNINKVLDGLLKPLLLAEGVNSIKTSDKMKNVNVDIVIEKLNSLDILTTKINLKEKLLELANSL